LGAKKPHARKKMARIGPFCAGSTQKKQALSVLEKESKQRGRQKRGNKKKRRKTYNEAQKIRPLSTRLLRSRKNAEQRRHARSLLHSQGEPRRLSSKTRLEKEEVGGSRIKKSAGGKEQGETVFIRPVRVTLSRTTAQRYIYWESQGEAGEERLH